MSLNLDANTPHAIATCVHKTRYNRAHAKYIVWVMRKRMQVGLCEPSATGCRLHAYKCPVCDCWHIGNTRDSV